MKKNIFLSGLILAVLFAPAMAFAVGSEGEDVTDDGSRDYSWDDEFEQDDYDAFDEKDIIVNEARNEPVAVVSEPKRVSLEPATSSIEASESRPEEMEARWKALFSKDDAPGTILYTVKSGDSLYVLARKNHTTVDLIKKINGLKSDNIYIGKKIRIRTAPFSIVVDKSENTLTLYSDGVPVKKYSVATGKNNTTPVGDFKITDKLENPTWFKTGAILPPGSPDNGLGTRWMGFDKPSYGIHGTIKPESIGTQASEGCIRMMNENVEELYGIVPSGTKVTVQD